MKSFQRSVNSCLRVLSVMRLKRGVMAMPTRLVAHFWVTLLALQSLRTASCERLRIVCSPAMAVLGPLEGGVQPARRRPCPAAS